jgi:glycolate oxidase
MALDLIQLTLEQGGTLSAEHGIGMAKTPYVHRQLGASVDVMRQIKKTMDPKNILNPGKLVFDDGIKDIFENSAFDALIRNPDNLKSFGPEVDQEILACTQCGFCHAGCPTYAMTKLESMNARGRVALAYNMLTNQISPSADLTARLYQCTDCLNCKYTCPAAVNLSAIIHAARERLVRDGQLPEVHRKLMESIVTHGNPFSEPATKRTDVFPKAFKAKQTANTLFFLGCVASFQDTKITPSIMRLADAAAENYTVLGAAEYCCGYLSYLVGDGKTFARCREETVSRIKTSGADTVVATCAGCYKTLSALYPKHGSDFEGIRVIHAIEYLEKVIVQGRLPLKADESHLKVVYHDPCDIGRHMGIYEPPRNVIRSIPGVELVEFPLNRSLAKCCGGGGGVKAFDNSLASDIAFDRVKQALDLRADAIVSACPSCKNSLNQGSARARKEKIGKIRVMDLTELVASRLE